MGYWGPQEGGIGLSKIIVLVLQLVIFVIAISLAIIALSPLDFTGDLAKNIPVIVFIIAIMASFIVILIILAFIPEIITRE